MTLRELIIAVKENNLDKDMLEGYRDQLSGLFAQMQLELADIEKEKALYFDSEKTIQPELSDISIKRKWQATQKGLRELELKRYCLATKEMLSSLKSRLYNIF